MAAKKDCNLRGVTTLLGDEPHLGRLIAELRAGRSRRVYGLPSSAQAVTTAALARALARAAPEAPGGAERRAEASPPSAAERSAGVAPQGAASGVPRPQGGVPVLLVTAYPDRALQLAEE